jgi:prohibitin 2
VEKVIKPEVRANLRYLMGQYTPAEIYTSQGFLIRRTVENALPELAERHIVLDDLLIKAITLPRPVAAAIEDKMRQQQAYLEYEFRIKREEKEKERKTIEAEGIRAFEELAKSESPQFRQYLTYLGVYATLALAQSPNSKVVMVGNRDNGLPMVLGMPDQSTQTPPSTNQVTNDLAGLSQGTVTNQSQVTDLQTAVTAKAQEIIRFLGSQNGAPPSLPILETNKPATDVKIQQ